MDGKTLGNKAVSLMTADAEQEMFKDGWGDPGITLRQHYAGLAMAACLSQGHAESCDVTARWAVENADALLAELAK